MKPKSDARLVLLVFGVFSASFWNPRAAQAADAHALFEGEKTTWHEGFDRFDYVMDEESFAITPFTHCAIRRGAHAMEQRLQTYDRPRLRQKAGDGGHGDGGGRSLRLGHRKPG